MAGELSLKTPLTGLVTLVPTNTATDKTITLPATTGTMVVQDGTNTTTVTNLAYTGTLTGGTGVVNLGSGQVYKDALGQLGIGTASPGYRLDVAAGDTTANFGYAVRLRSNATATAATLQFTNSGVTTENGYIRVTDTGLMSFSDKAYITSAGNVGIGTASPTSVSGYTALNIKSTNGGELQLGNTAGTAQATFWADANGITYTNYAATSHIWVTAASEKMRILSGGNVGIGTTSPQAKLAVSNGGAAGLEFFVNYPGGGVGTYIQSYNRSSPGYVNTAYDAADHSFRISGTEKMFLNSSGNLGIGTASPLGILDARGAVYLGNTSTGTGTFVRGAPNWNFAGLNVIRNAANTSTPRLIAMPLDGDDLASTTIGAYNAIWGAYDSSPTTGSTSSALNGAMVYGAYAGHRWFNNGSEKMRITASGDVGIGTISPTSTLTVQGTPNGGTVSFKHAGTNSFGTILTLETIGGTDDPVLSFKNYNGGSPVYYGIVGTDDGALGFRSNASTGGFGDERMRLDSSGNLLVGTTSSSDNTSGIKLSPPSSGSSGTLKCMKTASGGINSILNYHSGTYVGGVNFDNTSTSFPTSSDVRLKKDIVDAPSALLKVQDIRIVSHGWKHDYAVVEFGVIAQELVSVAPSAVTQGDDGEEVVTTWSVDYSKLVPILTKAIQELTARLEVLENK